MCQSDDGHPDITDNEVANEAVDDWQTRFKDAEMAVSRLSARLRGRDQRILLLERALARTVALHHVLEDRLERRLERCSMQLQRDREPDMTDDAPTDPHDKGVIVRLPHLTQTLSQLFDVMWEHWAEWDPERPPKSSTVARAIDARLGLKGQATGEASRSAQTFAAALRPDSVSETDGRHHR